MLHRTDVRFRVSHAEATPDRLAVRDSLAARLNKSADEVVVRRLDTKFGMRETIGEAKVYRGPDVAMDVEQEHMLARNKIGDMAEEAPEPAAEEEEVEAEADADAEAPEAEAEAEEAEAEADAEADADAAEAEADDEEAA